MSQTATPFKASQPTLERSWLASFADALDPTAEAAQADPADIAAWFPLTLGGQFYDKQLEMATAVLERGRVAVLGCNSSGKDFMAARIALWWVAYWRYRREPAKVVITGPTSRQVSEIVWQELRSAYLSAAVPQGGDLYRNPLCRWDADTFVYGFATDKDYKLQGFHSPHLLVIVTEAHGFAQGHFEALYRLHPQALLLTGNPISESGEFYEAFNQHAGLWHGIQIDAEDTPNFKRARADWIPGLVTPDDMALDKERLGEDNPLFQITYKAAFVEGMGQLVVVPLSYAKAAEDAWAAEKYSPGKIQVLGVDVARRGRDRTVVYSRWGRVVKKLAAFQGQDTAQTADWLAAYHKEHPQAQIVVDGVGVGGGVIDSLRKQGVGCIDFQGGASAASSRRYVNRVSEAWWRMRLGFLSGLAVCPDPDLKRQVSSRRYEIQGDKRIALEPKDEMHETGRHSPDEADALALTFALDWQLDGHRDGIATDADREVPEELQAAIERGYPDTSKRAPMTVASGANGHGRWSGFRGGYHRG